MASVGVRVEPTVRLVADDLKVALLGILLNPVLKCARWFFDTILCPVAPKAVFLALVVLTLRCDLPVCVKVDGFAVFGAVFVVKFACLCAVFVEGSKKSVANPSRSILAQVA